MRILLVVMFGLILAACGQDYEEVYGIKIGAPVKEVADLDDYEIPEEYQFNDIEEGLVVYKKKVEGEIFQFIYIGAINDVVHMVDIINYIGVSEDQLNQVVNERIEEFGEPINVQVVDEYVTDMTFKGRGPVAELLLSYNPPYRGSSSSVNDEKIFFFGISYRTKEIVEIDKAIKASNNY